MHSVVGRTFILTLMMASPAIAQIPSNCDPNSDKQRPFDPAHYVKIFEETSGRRIVLYDPRTVLTSPTLLRADADSKIVLEIDPDCLGSDMALNALFVSAELSRSDASAGPVKVEVLNYSEVAADPRTQASQDRLRLHRGRPGDREGREEVAVCGGAAVRNRINASVVSRGFSSITQ
jgi:hypothetical protein